ncbi:DUF4845 domain-containing protein [Caenimonas koreensis]|uniref:DUF4845 domain-containing protein n=1 Tax=Caenimonas koreensis DSM 17982 TaxID=1121255 RepID=A0A844B3A5_9BURK|nr:DUF4845 domain-containing protein [Caenimonas koreensis]MRD47703.1 DUF4845 domain-containing protein [Caenimonas koreensis DSM 17982]
MTRGLKTRQAGISFVGLLFVVGVLACLGVLGAQAFPTVIEYQAIQKAVTKSAQEGTVIEIRKSFDKAAQVDDIKSVTGKDLDITKVNDQIIVKYAYSREIHMFGPAFLLLKYEGQGQSTAK